jgi:hypothetical protein
MKLWENLNKCPVLTCFTCSSLTFNHIAHVSTKCHQSLSSSSGFETWMSFCLILIYILIKVAAFPDLSFQWWAFCAVDNLWRFCFIISKVFLVLPWLRWWLKSGWMIQHLTVSITMLGTIETLSCLFFLVTLWVGIFFLNLLLKIQRHEKSNNFPTVHSW